MNDAALVLFFHLFLAGIALLTLIACVLAFVGLASNSDAYDEKPGAGGH
ncbi:hypothetical protein [Frondihabitans cladoniiphilus]